ncbi:peptidoglycan recognition family protein [Nonomuraea wenchangensis]
MQWLTQLAEVARRTGHPVTEVKGWKTRGHGPQPAVEGIVCHHSAGPSGGGDYPSLAVVRSGRPGLDGPLSQFGLGRSGRIYVIAAGRCWHNAPSTSGYHTNSNSIGIEAESDGRQPWPAIQLDAYRKLCAELCKEFGLSASRVKGHKEVNTAKPDPHSINMHDFRLQVARLIEGDDDVDVDAVWHDARIKMNKGEKDETAVSPAAFLQRIETEQDRIKAMLTQVLVRLDALDR